MPTLNNLSPKDEVQLARAACYESLDVFAAGAFSIVNPGILYKWNWHIDCMAEYAEAVYRGDIKRLIVNVIPRSLKSYFWSIILPAWVLGKKPYEQFMVASHTMRPLASKLSDDTRRLMVSEWYQSIFPECKIEKNTEQYFVTSQNGHRMATSVLGSPTGMGFNFGILDDPNKPDEALSDVIRTKTNDWIDGTFMSRMNDRTTGRVVCVMQRVHENDVTGHLIDKGGYEVLKLPVENRTGKAFSYSVNQRVFDLKPNELLHEDRFPEPVIAELERDLGSYPFAGQYLQEPVPIGGGLFRREWIQYYDRHSFTITNCNLFILCDPAGVGGIQPKRKKSDWTVFQVAALAPDNNYYLLDMVRDKFNPTERIDALFELHEKWNGKSGKSPRVGYESYGLQSDLHYIEKKQNEESYRFQLIPLGGKMSKNDRIARLIPDLENKRWYFPKELHYTDTRGLSYDLVAEMINGEMATFPFSKHDDSLDALSRIYDDEVEARFPRIKRRSSSGPVDEGDWRDF